MKALFIYCIFTVCFSALVGAENECQTADGNKGDCIQLLQCEFLYSKLTNPRLSAGDRNHLAKSQCGTDGRYPLVCCPKNSLTSPNTEPTKLNTTESRAGFLSQLLGSQGFQGLFNGLFRDFNNQPGSFGPVGQLLSNGNRRPGIFSSENNRPGLIDGFTSHGNNRPGSLSEFFSNDRPNQGFLSNGDGRPSGGFFSGDNNRPGSIDGFSSNDRPNQGFSSNGDGFGFNNPNTGGGFSSNGNNRPGFSSNGDGSGFNNPNTGGGFSSNGNNRPELSPNGDGSGFNNPNTGGGFLSNGNNRPGFSSNGDGSGFNSPNTGSSGSRRSGLTESDLPPPGMCGTQIRDRIYGGTETSIGEYPWLALIEYTKRGYKGGYFCGGSLINKDYVITAAHCMKSKSLLAAGYKPTSIRLGEHNLLSEEDCEEDLCADPVVDVRIASITVHENYDPDSNLQNDDIALIRLSRPVQSTDYVRPICLPFARNVRNRLLDREPLSVSGFGKTETASKSDVKLKVEVDGFNFDRCKELYRVASVSLISSQLCAGGKEGEDSCQGDSGGPLMGSDKISSQPYTYLAGIVSFGLSTCGQRGYPGVYTRVDQYLDWILQHMER